MKKIILLCNMGLSTSALMKKMQDYANEVSFACEISAHPAMEAASVASDADCVLLGPQISYQLNNVKKLLPNQPVEAIAMQAYGMLDGKAVLIQAMKLMKVKE